ncbi:MAG TPA: exopolysaccharide biosynthesis protein [Microbacteriaceae bacterium]|nr:exopolysaccharide biosynthesis protein [Microbacteriaceae bacterium]
MDQRRARQVEQPIPSLDRNHFECDTEGCARRYFHAHLAHRVGTVLERARGNCRSTDAGADDRRTRRRVRQKVQPHPSGGHTFSLELPEDIGRDSLLRIDGDRAGEVHAHPVRLASIIIFSGVLVDSPIRFLGIQGNLAELGPLQGIFGTRNQLGVITLIAIVTFGTELRTRSVRRGVSIGSLVLAGLLLLLTRSPIAFGGLIIVVLAALALFGLRRVPAESKQFWQIGLLAATITVAAAAWAARTPIITALSASNELNKRLDLWRPMRILIPAHELEGWGWVGHWRQDVPPFQVFPNYFDRMPTSGMNAYLDVWFQLGLIGLFAFVGLVGLTFIRSWLLASRQRSFVYAWPALVLVVLLTTGLAESSMLVEFGWLTFVVCCVKAARELSWRKAFAATGPASLLQ